MFAENYYTMKFTKEQAIEKLNQVLTNDGKKPLRMSERTLKAQVENLLTFITDEEMELDDFVTKVKGGLESINSNIEHDASEAIRVYKEQNPAPKPDTKPDTEQEPNPDDPNAELLRRLKELEDKEAKRSREVTLATKKSELRKYLKDKNVDNEKWVDSILGMTTITEETEVETLGESVVKLYNESLSGGEVITPRVNTNPGEGGGSDTFASVKAIRKQRAELNM